MKALEGELGAVGANVGSQLSAKDELINQLQDQVTLWRNKYEALAKLYSQLRTEHLDMLSKFKQMQLKANSAQEAIDRMERMERDVKAKNLEMADMLKERDRTRHDMDRLKGVSLVSVIPVTEADLVFRAIEMKWSAYGVTCRLQTNGQRTRRGIRVQRCRASSPSTIDK